MDRKRINVAVLGSTGSIGSQMLEIADSNNCINIVALTCKSKISIIEQQARKYKPVIVAVLDEGKAKELRIKLADMNIKVVSGMEGLEEAATVPAADIVVTAFVGMIGIRPTVAAIKAGKNIALANKETLVTAGHIIMPLINQYNNKLLPVDSEHSAIFQSLEAGRRSELEKILLTASGGPFRGYNSSQLESVQLRDALAHPNWNMGSKITIDSATLVNKALEVMEAGWLFDIEQKDIEVLVHPQSIVHSMVQFRDGAVIAQMGIPDMKLPIQYALFYPERLYMNTKRVDFTEIGSLSFEKPDSDVFRGFRLGLEAGAAGGSLPVVFNAANEAGVEAFLDNKIKFIDISVLIEKAMQSHNLIQNPSLEDIFNIEQEIRIRIKEWISIDFER